MLVRCVGFAVHLHSDLTYTVDTLAEFLGRSHG